MQGNSLHIPSEYFAHFLFATPPAKRMLAVFHRPPMKDPPHVQPDLRGNGGVGPALDAAAFRSTIADRVSIHVAVDALPRRSYASPVRSLSSSPA